MKNIIDFIKDKSYYFLGGTVIIFILLIIIGSCSNNSGGSYEAIENKMVSAAKEYYANRKDRLPKEENGTVKVTIGTLVEAELINEVVDPSDKSNTCSGYVEVTKVGEEYSYLPFLTCKGNYEPKYLKDIVKDVKQDEYGNGVYTIGNELVYRGDDVDNYVSFNNQLWRIVKVDNEGDIKLVLAENTKESYIWDSAYNSEKGSNVGITSDFLHTNMRKVLNIYYENNFDNDSKAKIVTKKLCMGGYLEGDSFSVEKECSIVKEDEKVVLLNATDYQNASLGTNCLKLNSPECSNYNYLAASEINTWIINTYSENSYEVYYLNGSIEKVRANNARKINPVIYLTSKVVVNTGEGTIESPFIIK